MKLVLERMGAFALALLALGLPVATPTAFLVLVVCGVVIAGGRHCHTSRRVGLAVLLSGGIAILVPMLQPDAVLRSEQVFLLRNSAADGIYRTSLPPPVFELFRKQFEEAYPFDGRCNSLIYRDCWLNTAPADAEGAFSFDGIWQSGKKIEGAFRFSALPDMRAGFANDRTTLWSDNVGKGSDVLRASPPHYVRLQWLPDARGGTLCWQGIILWEELGQYLIQQSDRMMMSSCRMVTAVDVGRTAYGAAINPEAPLAMTFTLSRVGAIREGAAILLRLSGALAVALLLTELASLPALWPIAALIVLGGAIMATAAKGFLLGSYPSLSFGPALQGEAMGRVMAQALLHGDMAAALSGGEALFGSAPGLRFFRAAEKLVFGDGFGGSAVLLLLLLPVLFRLAKGMMDNVSAWLVVLVFVSGALGVAGFSARILYHAAESGTAGPLAMVFFMAGLAGVMSELQGRRKQSFRGGSVGVLLALATLLDPLLLPASLAVLGYVAMRVRGDAAGLLGGYGMLLALVPLHNMVFGGRPWPLHQSPLFADMAMSPAAWFVSLSGFFGSEGRSALRPLADHLGDMLFIGDGAFAAFGVVARLAMVGCGIWAAVSRRSWLSFVKPVALAGLGMAAMTLFYVPDINHFMLVSILNLLVVCALGWHVGVRPARPRIFRPPE